MKNQKRGKNVALLGVALQTIFLIAMLVIWQRTGSRASFAGLWVLLAALPMWLMTAMLFYARQQAEQETLAMDDLASSGETSIFSGGDAAALRPLAARVRFFEVWLIPILTGALAIYHLLIGWWMMGLLAEALPSTPVREAEGGVFCLLLGFAGFLFSRYCTGMGSRDAWKPLRAMGSYLLLGVLVFGTMFVALLLASQGYPGLEAGLARVFPVVQILLGIELILNLTVSFYRPRMPDQQYAPPYDSRLLGLAAEPGKIGHSITETLNYQFGFEVSKTWFYQLLSKAFVPLVILAVLVMWLLTSLVVVEEGETYVLKKWGRLEGNLSPGLHVKWPWPIATAERFNTGEIHQLVLGVGDKVEPTKGRDGQEIILWTQEHGFGAKKEVDFLIGAKPRAGQGEGEAPPVSIIKLVVAIQYRIVDPMAFGYTYVNGAEMLRCVASEEMTQYCASATLDTKISDDTTRPQAIMTTGRTAAAAQLQRRIQTRVDAMHLGVKLEFLGIASAHPPAAAVPQFEKVLEAERLQDQQRYVAESKANRILGGVAGDPGVALQMYLALHRAEVFEALDRLKGDQARFDRAAGQYIQQAREQIKALTLEIEREKLLGKVMTRVEETPTGPREIPVDSRAVLRTRYQAFLAELESARKARTTFAYTKTVATANTEIDRQFDLLEGTPANLIAKARAKRWTDELAALRALQTYRRRLLPYRAAPDVYRFDRYMDVWDESLPDMKKYVLGVDKNRIQIRLNLEEQKDVLGGAFSSDPEGK